MTAAYRDTTFTSADGLTLYYRDYAPAQERGWPVICLPGISRNSADFEELAVHLAQSRRVISPDLRGRGRSDPDPDYRNYHPETYRDDVLALLDHAGVARAVFVGTSLGGLVTMMCAEAEPARLAGAVLNDIGPEINPAGVARIAGYLGNMPPVRTWADAAQASRTINQLAFPEMTDDADWLDFAKRLYVEGPDGVPAPAYDPRIGDALREVGAGPTDLWPFFRALKSIPTLLVHGVLSDILTDVEIAKMVAEKPDLAVAHIRNVGHAPMLIEPDALVAIESFLSRLG